MLPTTPLEQRYWRRSWRWSFALHVGVVLFIVVEALWLPMPFLRGPAGVAPAYVEAAQQLPPEPLEMEMVLEERSWVEIDAEEIATAQVDLSDPRWQEVLLEPERHARESEPHSESLVAAALIQEQLRAAIQQSEQQTLQENLAQLEKLSERLTSVSSEETIDELSGTLTRLVGTDPRATKPKEGAVGTFDFSSAQPHDCTKETTAEGNVRYVVVMIDQNGLTQEIELDQASGEQMYNTMRIIKSNPLLERVYRGAVMGILDKLLQPAK